MRHLIRMAAVTCCAIAFCGAPASASPVTFIHSGSGSGSLEGVPFGVSAFTITASGDTSDRTNLWPGIFSITHDTATIAIDGLGHLDLCDTHQNIRQQ